MAAIHYLALGANLAGQDGRSPQASCEAAAQELARLPWVRRVCRSRWYSTSPFPVTDQPRYINGLLRIESDVRPRVLLAACQAIEARAGRVRGEENAARTLDVDIIDMEGLVRGGPDPVLPHPRAHLRAFVLLPLRDLAPDWVHPVLRVPVSQLIAALGPQDIRPA